MSRRCRYSSSALFVSSAPLSLHSSSTTRNGRYGGSSEEDDVPHLYAIKDSITGKILVETTMIPDYPEYWKPTHYDIITLVERKDNAHEVFLHKI